MVSLTYTSNGKLLQLHVSETTPATAGVDTRHSGQHRHPQLLLTLIALAVVWYGLKQGLRPLEPPAS